MIETLTEMHISHLRKGLSPEGFPTATAPGEAEPAAELVAAKLLREEDGRLFITEEGRERLTAI